MFCPSCGTRNPEGVRFCRACGADLSGRGVGTTASQAATQAPAPGAPAFARPAAAARGRSAGRRRVIAGIAAAVAVALVVAVGLRTNWFGLAQPHLTPGTYILIDSTQSYDSTGSYAMVFSVAEGDHLSLTVKGTSWVGGDVNWLGGGTQVSQVGGSGLYVRAPLSAAPFIYGAPVNNKFARISNALKSTTALRLGDGQLPDYTLNLVVPRNAPESIVGTWAFWVADERGLPKEDLRWTKVEGDGTLRTGSVSTSNATYVAESLKQGTFQGSSDAESGSWVRQGDGSFALTFPDSSHTFTFQYRR